MASSNKTKQSHYSEKIDSRETGTWRGGIANLEMQTLLGELIGDWVHIEEAMITIMDLLIYPDVDTRLGAAQKARGFSPAQQILRPISSNNTRAKVMSALLSHYPGDDKRKLDSLRCGNCRVSVSSECKKRILARPVVDQSRRARLSTNGKHRNQYLH
jgi:hypothetical protein